MIDSTPLTISVDISEKELAEKMRKLIESVNISDVLELRLLCACMFFIITWCSLLSFLQQVLMLHQSMKRSRYSNRSTHMKVRPRMTRIKTMFKIMNMMVKYPLKMQKGTR